MGTRAGIFDTMLAVWVRLLAEAAAQQERSPREVRCAKACSEEFPKKLRKIPQPKKQTAMLRNRECNIRFSKRSAASLFFDNIFLYI